jgi:hypothetical protein
MTVARPPRHLLAAALLVALALAPEGAALANDVGRIKVSRGAVHIERAGQRLPAPVGTGVRASDVVVTGADGSVGIAFADLSLLSAGPGSTLVIDRFSFDSTTHQGAFETSLRRGTLAVVSGKIAKQSPDAMKVRTPVTVLGARGTEFAVRAGAPAP